MRVCEKYHLSKTQLLNTWFLEDIFNAIESMDKQIEVEYQHSLEMEKRNKK